MAATFVSKKCNCILELYKAIHFDANYFKQVETVPFNKLLTYQHGFIVAYCSNMEGYQCRNHNIVFFSFGIGRMWFEFMQTIFTNNLI